MSDELDTAAGDASDDTVALTQPLRPTGKRSRQRTGGTALAEVEDLETTAIEIDFDDDDDDDEAKAKKAKKDKAAAAGATRNPFLYVWNYLRQVIAELRKVIWPNRKQMVSYTSVVLVFLIFMVSLIGGVDLGLSRLVLLVFG